MKFVSRVVCKWKLGMSHMLRLCLDHVLVEGRGNDMIRYDNTRKSTWVQHIGHNKETLEVYIYSKTDYHSRGAQENEQSAE